MRQPLNSFSYLSLLVLWDCVFSEPGYLLLKQSHHTALSRSPVYVNFSIQGNYSLSTNVSVNLLDVQSNQIVTSKALPANQSQGDLEFECIHFVSAGLYHFQMSLQTENDTYVSLLSSLLNVTWPIFHIDLNRSAKDALRSFQVGVFTNEQMCFGFPDREPKLFLEVEHTHSFQEMEEPSTDRFMLYKTYKEIPLSSSQWVEFECASVRPEAFITVSLKPMLSESVIAYMGPVDLVKTFKYKVVTMMEKKCDTAVAISIIAPPCNYAEGKIIVYKQSPKIPGESITTLAENTLRKGEKSSHFNCTLFEIGKNEYCFEFLMSSGGTLSYSAQRAKQCIEIRREIETWSQWQPWSSCNVTCGYGYRERYRKCLSLSPVNAQCNGKWKETSPCSLEDCLTVEPSSKSTTNNKDNLITSNTVTITGISLCLFIICITIVITVWRRLTKTGTCSTTSRHSSSHSASCRKNSDEENIYQVRESFSDAGDAQQESIEEEVHIPLNYRQSTCGMEEQTIADNSQKLIPPIFSYRLAQQQLKEMKQKGLKEATKVYHVSQNPMADTAVDVSLAPPLVPENLEETAANKFRIQSPFLETKNGNTRNVNERPSSKSVFPPTHGPSQTLPKIAHVRNNDAKGKYDRSYQKNNFRRTSSFHETKHVKPYRERSLTSLSPRHTMVYNSRTKMWESSTIERPKHKPVRLEKSPENLTRGTSLPLDATGHSPKKQYLQPGESKPDIISSRYIAGKSKPERSEQNRTRKGPSPVEKSWKRAQDVSPSPKDNYQRNYAHSPSYYRKEKCQSFPWGAEYSFYDNSTFGLTDAEQQMLDLPGYFASNEEDETSTLSIERLVL